MKIYLLLIITLLLTSSSIFAQFDDEEDDEYYEYDETPAIYSVVKNAQGMCGLIRIADKKLVIPYIFKKIEINTEIDTRNYAYVYVDHADYDPAKPNNSGIYSIKDNRVIVPCKYVRVYIENPDFYPNDDKYLPKFCGFEAFEVVEGGDNIFHHYSRQGKLMISTKYETELSPKGKYLTDTIIGYLRDKEEKQIGYYIFNAKTGIVYQQKTFKSIEYSSSDKFMIVQNNDGKYGVINCMTGVFLIQPNYENINEAGMCYVGKKGKQWSVINSGGKVIIPPGSYDSIGAFNCCTNLKIRTCAFAVLKNGKWGAVTEQNKVVLPFEYDQAFEYGDSIWISKNNKWGMVTHAGSEVIPFQYDSLSKEYNVTDDFYYYSVRKEKLWGCINTNGQALLPIEYDTRVVYADTMWVIKNGKTGCVDKNLKQIIDFKFDPAVFSNFSFAKDGIACTKSGKAIMLDKKGNEIVVKTLAEAIATNDEKAFRVAINSVSEKEKAWALKSIIADNNLKLFRIIISTKPKVNDYFNYTYSVPIGQVAELARGGDRESTFKEMIGSLILCGSQLDYPELIQGSPVRSYLMSNYSPNIDLLEYLLKAGCRVDKSMYSKLPSTSNSKEIKEMLKQYER